VPLPGLSFVDLEGDPADVVARVPAAPGVGQFLGPEGRNLTLAPAANLRKWVASHLGLGKPPAPGRRPRTNLSGIATSVGWARTASPFAQRLLYERLVAPIVPVAERRDLKPPAFLHLEPAHRFPRVSVRSAEEGPAGLYGPFRNRRAAERARDAVNHVFALRPCDYAFEPDPELALGLGCLFAQVRSCAAPCLARTSEEDYQALAGRVAAWLAGPGGRPDAPASVPASVARVQGARAVVLGVGRKEVGLYPVREGRVLEAAALTVESDQIAAAAAGLEWPAGEGPDDWPWLAAWIASPRGRSSYVPLEDVSDRLGLAETIRARLPARFARPRAGGNVGTSRGGT
jgi:hypothetical protein